MKKRCLLLIIPLIFSIASCETSSSSIISTMISRDDSDSLSNDSSSRENSNTSTSIDSSSSNNSSTESFTTSINLDELVELEINQRSIDTNFGRYETGNSGNEYTGQYKTVDNYRFSFYLAVNSYDGFIELLPYIKSKEDGTISGSFLNYDSITNIHHIDISYKTDTTSSEDGIKVFYGRNYPLINSYSKPCVNSFETISLELNFANYFRVEAVNENLTIESINIFYKKEESRPIEKVGINDNNYRISPIVYEEELVSGESSIEIPTEIKETNGKYTVLSSKTLTYYEQDDVISGKYSVEEASIVDPFDVISYRIAFGEYPPNYGTSIPSYFGKYGRRISKRYTRTDGYVNAVPGIVDAPLFNELGYYELDIALKGDDSYGRSRGTGRVVFFYAGINQEGYENDIYAVYTDDHYATFQEYLGFGFSDKFDAQTTRTGYRWSKATTLQG